jgi:hypothetical protein
MGRDWEIDVNCTGKVGAGICCHEPPIFKIKALCFKVKEKRRLARAQSADSRWSFG